MGKRIEYLIRKVFFSKPTYRLLCKQPRLLVRTTLTNYHLEYPAIFIRPSFYFSGILV